jgi:hypothetical protein
LQAFAGVIRYIKNDEASIIPTTTDTEKSKVNAAEVIPMLRMRQRAARLLGIFERLRNPFFHVR